MTDGARRLVVDLAATSKNWALTPAGETRLRAEAPEGWEIAVVRAPTSSDGDGPQRASRGGDRTDRGGGGLLRLRGHRGPVWRAPGGCAGCTRRRQAWGTSLRSGIADTDILLTNAAGIHSIPMAEFIVGGLLHFTRGLDVALDQQRRGEWSKAFFVADDSPLRELGDMRVLIVGDRGNRPGRRRHGWPRSARRARGCGGGPSSACRPASTSVVGPTSLDAELARADVLVLAAPLTSGTTRLMTRERLERLPAGAIVVNVARGALMDEDAVADLLEGGRLRGGGTRRL